MGAGEVVTGLKVYSPVEGQGSRHTKCLASFTPLCLSFLAAQRGQ